MCSSDLVDPTMSYQEDQGNRPHRGLNWISTKLHFRTDASLNKNNIGRMTDSKLLASRAGTRMAVSSSATGTIIYTLLSVPCPFFAPAAAINLWQWSTSMIDRHRINREDQGRRAQNDGYKALSAKANHPARDIALGCTIKISLASLGVGMVGLDPIMDNTAGLLAGDMTNHSGLKSLFTDALPGFLAKHPHTALADHVVHGIVAQPGDKIVEEMASLSHMNIGSETTWQDIFNLKINDIPEALLVILADGVMVELITILTPTQLAIDETYQKYAETSVKARR